MGALRGFYAFAQGFPFADVDSFEGFNTLKNWQMIQAPMVGRAVLDVLNYLWYPNVAGFTGGPPVGFDLLFIFDPPERHSLPLSSENWLSIPRVHASFGKERRRLDEVFVNSKGAIAEAAAHGRLLHSRVFSADEQAVLVLWAVKATSRLLYDLTDLSNFTEENQPSASIDPVFAFEHALTVDRLIRLTLRAMSLDEPSAAKTTVFEVADLYDSLSERFGNTPQGSTEFFKRLFNTQEAPKLIGAALRKLPEPFGSYLGSVCDRIYSDLERVVRDSVWLRSMVRHEGVDVRSKDLSKVKTEGMGQFVGNVMRALRNSHHGYFTLMDRDKGKNHKAGSSRYLWPIDGNTPDALTALPSIWLLAYLQDPSIVGWKPLPLQSFD